MTKIPYVEYAQIVCSGCVTYIALNILDQEMGEHTEITLHIWLTGIN